MANHINFPTMDVFTEKPFILDTNVWLYLYSEYNTSDFVYSLVYEKLIEENADILLPPLVATEIVNRYCRQSFEIYKNRFPRRDRHLIQYKRDFRNTEEFRTAHENILEILENDIKDISRFVPIIETDLDHAICTPCLDDLNDNIIVNIAERENAIIVSHDRDFLGIERNIDIIRL